MVATKVLHKEKTLVPKLRFKGFDDGWEKKTLFDISENVSYGMNAAATEYDGFHKYIRITDIDVNSGEFKPDPLTSPLGEIDEKFKLKEGDIVFARTGASVGKSYLYNPKDGALYFAGFLIKFSITKANPLFIYSLTLKEAYNKWVHVYSMRSGQPGLNAEEYKAFKLNIPTSDEQHKIAAFLSAVDEKLQQLTRKKELLEKYKKGVMQQLFSGKLRFKDENGKAFPKWEEKKLGGVGDFKNGLNKDKNEFGFGSPFVNLMDVFGKRELNNQPFDLVNSNASEKELYSMQKGDVLFIRSSVKRSGVGEAVVVNEDLPQTVYSGFLIRFRDNRKTLDQKFKKYCFANYSFRKELLSYATTSANTNINQESLNFVKLYVPVVEEQKKIANCLSGIDNKIEIVNKQITQTQTFKKGLLQQMFV